MGRGTNSGVLGKPPSANNSFAGVPNWIRIRTRTSFCHYTTYYGNDGADSWFRAHPHYDYNLVGVVSDLDWEGIRQVIPK